MKSERWQRIKQISEVASALLPLRMASASSVPGRLWAALQAASGGPWAGCIYDVDRIVDVITAGLAALDERRRLPEQVERP